ncbi:hypothetical protein CRUP_017563 [Coryphaenoides rupestris]|nr:hypothetical protein CRUP_017563 [Coryphaenoides rupestris]
MTGPSPSTLPRTTKTDLETQLYSAPLQGGQAQQAPGADNKGPWSAGEITQSCTATLPLDHRPAGETHPRRRHHLGFGPLKGTVRRGDRYSSSSRSKPKKGTTTSTTAATTTTGAPGKKKVRQDKQGPAALKGSKKKKAGAAEEEGPAGSRGAPVDKEKSKEMNNKLAEAKEDAQDDVLRAHHRGAQGSAGGESEPLVVRVEARRPASVVHFAADVKPAD